MKSFARGSSVAGFVEEIVDGRDEWRVESNW